MCRLIREKQGNKGCHAPSVVMARASSPEIEVEIDVGAIVVLDLSNMESPKRNCLSPFESVLLLIFVHVLSTSGTVPLGKQCPVTCIACTRGKQSSLRDTKPSKGQDDTAIPESLRRFAIHFYSCFESEKSG